MPGVSRRGAAAGAGAFHRASARLVRDHDAIVIEDLAVANLTRRPEPRPDPRRQGAYLPSSAGIAGVAPGYGMKQEPQPVTAGIPRL